MIMAPVATMGHVYAMITIMELTAQVNQFCYFIVNSFENMYHSKFEVKVTFSILFQSFIVACEPATNCSGHGICRPDGTCKCDSEFFASDCTSKL
jgi:hypothetical protein